MYLPQTRVRCACARPGQMHASTDRKYPQNILVPTGCRNGLCCCEPLLWSTGCFYGYTFPGFHCCFQQHTLSVCLSLPRTHANQTSLLSPLSSPLSSQITTLLFLPPTAENSEWLFLGTQQKRGQRFWSKLPPNASNPTAIS